MNWTNCSVEGVGELPDDDGGKFSVHFFNEDTKDNFTREELRPFLPHLGQYWQTPATKQGQKPKWQGAVISAIRRELVRIPDLQLEDLIGGRLIMKEFFKIMAQLDSQMPELLR